METDEAQEAAIALDADALARQGSRWEPAALPAIPGLTAGEVDVLARRMATTYKQFIEWTVLNQRKSLGEAIADDAANRDFMRERAAEILRTPPDEVAWWDLESCREVDEAAALAKWEEIKGAAREYVNSGSLAGDALQQASVDTPFKKAQFFAVRRGFIEQWQPHGTIEIALIDQMTQAYFMQMYWQDILSFRVLHDAKPLPRNYKEEVKAGWELPRLNYAEAQEFATNMVDRWNRIFLRQLRALRDMRRFSPPVTVNVAEGGQVNIGQQQVNTTGEVNGGGK